MLHVDNVTVTDKAWTIIRRARARHRSDPALMIALYYMPSFTNADGSNVEGFVPGYTIDFIAQLPPGDHWVVARLPDGTEFRFMPKFTWHPHESYVVDQASAYALSIGLAG